MDFKRDVKESEWNYLQKILFCQYFNENQFGNGAMLHPKWLIHDDIFQVVAHFFAASKAVKQLVKCEDIRMPFDVFCCVIPRKVVSLYDHNVIYEHSTGDLDEWLKMQNVNILHHRKLKRNKKQFNFASCILNHYRMMLTAHADSWNWESMMLIVIVDRRKPEEQSLIIVESRNTNSLLQILRNRMLGLQFSVPNKSEVHGGNVVRSWLYYGNVQRLRFWPEHLIWFIPHLFVKRARGKYTFIKRLYSDDYKRGFGVDLNDPHFNRYYKMLTGWSLDEIDVGFREDSELRAIKIGSHNSFKFWRAFDWYTVTDQSEMWVAKHRWAITKLFVESDVDCFSINQFRGRTLKQFVESLAQRTSYRAETIKELITNLVDTLSFRNPMNWNHVICAVTQEMNEAIAQEIESLQFDLLNLHPDSGQILAHQFKTKAKRRLTAAEELYLLSVIDRIFRSEKILVPIPQKSLVNELLLFSTFRIMSFYIAFWASITNRA